MVYFLQEVSNMDDLVKRLSEGEHKVAVTRANGQLSELKDMIDRDFVLVKFTETRGGTELGFSLDKERSDVDSAKLASGTGTVKLVGDLNLNYVDVRCVAEIDLGSLAGKGKLEILESQPAGA